MWGWGTLLVMSVFLGRNKLTVAGFLKGRVTTITRPFVCTVAVRGGGNDYFGLTLSELAF